MLDRIKKALLLLLVLLLPYHYQIFSVVLADVSVLKLWKEVVIGVLLIITLIQIIKKDVEYKISLFEKIMVAFIGIVVIYICVSGAPLRGLFISRIYFVPMLLVPVVRTTKITKDDLKKAMILVMANMIINCAWGIFQAYVLKGEFLIELGYGTKRVNHGLKLRNEFYVYGGGYMQRVTGTFAAPNTFGMYLAFFIVLLVYLGEKLNVNKKYTYVTQFIMVVTLFLTFSRTSWIACFAGVAIHFGLNNKKINKKKIFMGIALAIVAAVLAIVADYFVVKTGIGKAMASLLYNTVTGRDSSFNGHLDSWVDSVVKVAKHPLGLGLGKNGPRALKFIKYPNLTESSYFLMIFEVGIIGAGVYIASFVVACKDSISKYKETGKKEVMSMFAIVIMLGIAFLTLPYVQDFELLVMVYLIISIQYNSNTGIFE